jgi:release factor glutamine methyltransferase
MKLDPTISIEVQDGVYEPREDTHLLLSSIEVQPGSEVLEVGTGSGIIALHCAKAGTKVIATDISPLAVRNARANAIENSLDICVVLTDLAGCIGNTYDMIIFNPPYLMDDDTGSLSRSERRQVKGGHVGSELSVRFLGQALELLNEDGCILLLTSSESEASVLDIAEKFYNIQKVGERKIFFEILSAYRLTKTQSGSHRVQETKSD